jgi:photosystem II stability/assembly factor-like uncharacterized protein
MNAFDKDDHMHRLVQTIRGFVIFLLFLLICNDMIYAHVPHDVINDLKVSPNFSADRTVYAIVRDVLFKSTDGGLKWRRQSRGLCRHRLTAMAISPSSQRDEILFVACDKGEVYRSENGGNRWVRCATHFSSPVRAFAISPKFEEDGVLLARVAGGAIFQTKDGGKSWKRVFQNELNATAIDWEGKHVVIGTISGALFVSQNSGTTWTRWAQHPKQTKITCIELPQGFSLSKPFYVGTQDSGIWQIASHKDFQACSESMKDPITSIASYNEKDRLILLATTWDEALYRSEDDGKSWNKYASGLRRSSQAYQYKKPHFTHIAVADNSTVFLGGFCGLYRSDAPGNSWHKLDTIFHIIIGLDLSPATGSDFEVGISTYGGGTYSKNNHGDSWKINNTGLPSPRLGPIAYSPNYKNDKTIFTGTFDWSIKSTDKGSHWMAVALQSQNNFFERAEASIKNKLLRLPRLRKFVSSLGRYYRPKFKIPVVFAISPAFDVDRTVFAGLYPSGLYRSVDGGSSYSLVWDTFERPVRALAVSPSYANDKTLFVGLSEGLFRSQDGGANWQKFEQDFKDPRLAISPGYAFDNTVFVGSLTGLHVTRDGGVTWGRLQIGEPNTETAISCLAISPNFVKDRRLVVQVKGGDLLICSDDPNRFETVVSKSAEIGYEFSHIIRRESAPLIRFSPNYSHDNTIYGISGHDILKSEDGGMNWSTIKRPLRYEVEGSLTHWLFLPVQLKGVWNVNSNAACSNMRALYSTNPLSELTFRFVGSGVTWLGEHGPDHGMATVFIDGKEVARIDQYSEVRQFLVETFSKKDLLPGLHEITLRVEESKNPSATGSRVDVDALDVIGR